VTFTGGALLKGVPVKVSAASARLRFIPCGPVCIARGCTAKCCDAPGDPVGCKVYAHESEAPAIRRLGVKVKDGFIQPRSGERVCPFKTKGHLCSLFKKPERPMGCIVSPFALNRTGTLIIRNRYKLHLPCYDPEGGQPAYKVFRSSLVPLFGEGEVERLTKHLDAGGGDVSCYANRKVYHMMVHREEALG